jgi:predicted nuclease of restriction endonuclease-like RecB superfamily
LFRPDLVPVRPADGFVIPRWLGPEDKPWLEALVAELARYDGRPLRDWQARMLEPLGVPTPPKRLKLAAATLLGLCGREDLPRDPSAGQLRETLFAAAQEARDARRFAPAEVMAHAAAHHGLDAPDVMTRLFADIPAERRLKVPRPLPDPQDLALRTNLGIAQGFVRAASTVEITLPGTSRALMRQILLRRLLCTAEPRGGSAVLTVSGPFALFRHTTVYGSALASLVPVLRGASSFEIRASGVQHGKFVVARIASGDPIFPPGEAPPHDDRVGLRFAKDFAKAAPEWTLQRDPEPLLVDGAWVFPDFALSRGGRRWFVEIIGFWTREWLQARLQRRLRSGRTDLIWCVDTDLGAAERPLPGDPFVVPFDRRIDVAALKRVIDERPDQGS